MDNLQTHLPLNETMFFILVSLLPGPNHGYAIAKDVQVLSHQRVVLSASTLYTTLKRLLEDGWIERAGEGGEPDETGRPRKTYALTGLGKGVLNAEIERLEALASLARLRTAGSSALG
jgi:DNA-binding PadR family transcriptional regulator